MNSDERERIYIAKHYVSCLPCLLVGVKDSHADYHHVVEGKRLGHRYGFPMCLWHHRGQRDVNVQWMTHPELKKALGPSFASEKRKFLRQFGDERMLVDLTDYAIDLFRSLPWNEFEMPDGVAQMIRRRWTFLQMDKHAEILDFATFH